MAQPVRALLASSAVRYLLVGGLSLVVDVGLLTLLYEVVGTPLWLATLVGFWTSVVVNFLLQRAAFRSGAGLAGSAWRYGVLLGANTVVTVLVVDGAEAAGLGYAPGKLAAVALTTVWNFFLYRGWVFPAAPSSLPVAGTAPASAPLEDDPQREVRA
ncbi:GtrA family protein [Cellulomonas endophytica]|uniref:GtrA family protein n=1 Tax=Cellulomonas endophytica TaxID=2494735 RepID=UPI0010136DB1|nr:GtrA family protein [Cellulomonas endophytica]